jgi:hypothetical protein
MNGLIFLMIAIVFVLVAFATAFVTMGASPTIRRITNRVIYGSCIAALASVVKSSTTRFTRPRPSRYGRAR